MIDYACLPTALALMSQRVHLCSGEVAWHATSLQQADGIPHHAARSHNHHYFSSQVIQPSTSATQQAALFGTSIAPPDQGLCVGAGQLIDVVNSYLVVRSTATGAALSAPTTLTYFFQAGLPVFDLFDPRCEWHPSLWPHVLM
jgi:hypothetical protein